jgi:hypothetical protein
MISLEEAIQKVKVLWDEDKNNPIPLEAVYENLGYRSKGGYAARVIAALKKFGLIFEKQDDIILTNEAVDLMIHNNSDVEYIETLKKLAIKPVIYEKIYNDNNGSIPSDSALKIRLIKDYSFNPESVTDFIITFRKTLEFAGLIENKEIQSDMVLQDIVRAEVIKPGSDVPLQRNIQEGLKTFAIPLSKMKNAVISFEAMPLEKKDITNIKAWLDLFESSLTGIESESKEETKQE